MKEIRNELSVIRETAGEISSRMNGCSLSKDSKAARDRTLGGYAYERRKSAHPDDYEYGVVVNALNELRNDLIKDERPTDAVDELLLKTIDAPTRNRKKE